MNTPSATSCPLLQLPTELRLHILKYLLTASEPVMIHKRSNSESDFCNILKTSLHPLILQTCSQISTEGTDILYGCNTFEINNDYGHPYTTAQGLWLGHVGEANVERLHRINIIVCPRCEMSKRCKLNMRLGVTVHLRDAQQHPAYIGDWFTKDGPYTAVTLEPDMLVQTRLLRLADLVANAKKPMKLREILTTCNTAIDTMRNPPGAIEPLKALAIEERRKTNGP